MTNIILIHKTGGDFRISDAYLLVSHIHRYWGEGMKPNIYCYSDSVNKEIDVVGLTIRPLPNPEWTGWWSKMNMFSPELKDLRPFLYIDLDTAILKSLKSLIPPDEQKDKFVTLKDFYRPTHLASGLMWVPDTPKIDNLHSKWIDNTARHMRRFRGDQNFIEAHTEADIYWQDISQPEYITTFKPKGVWRTTFPDKSAVVCFHGVPRIPVAANNVDWVKSYTSYEI